MGMRKVKSILAIFCGFCLWQLIRLFVPGLEVHPIFIYIYGMMEIRETSEKQRKRKDAYFGYVDRRWCGTPIMFLTDWLWAVAGASLPALGGGVYSGGKPACPMRGRITGMPAFCGLATAIYIVLIVSHFESSMYLYSFMRAIQTILAVLIAWFINVKLLPYPPVPRSVSGWIMRRKDTSESEPQ